MSSRWLVVALGASLACGCVHGLPEPFVASRADLPARSPASAPASPPPHADKTAEPARKLAVSLDASPPPRRSGADSKSEKPEVVPAQAQLPTGQKDLQLLKRLDVPRELPGHGVRLLELPPLDKKQERDEAIKKAFPPLPDMGAEVEPAIGPDGHPLTLGELQALGMASSPQIRQAVADLEAARGNAIQAGLHPNPSIGYEGDTMGTQGLAGYQGGYLEQTVKTAGKLTYARAAAAADVANAELALRAARVDLATRVRNGYFAVLVARESLKVNRALVRFTDEIYKVRLGQLEAGQIAPYELAQFRVFAIQARNDLVEAINRDNAAWKQLAAAMGVPGMPPTLLAGSADMPIPRFDYAKVVAQVVARHTDVLTAENGITKARFNWLLEKVTPIPDIDLRVMLQKDYTSDTFLLAPSVAVGGKVPVWDQNQGAILRASAELARAQEDVQRVRNDLTGHVAEAFERYENSRQIVEYYRDHILPDLVRVYRGSVLRYQTEPEKLTFLDVAQPQQNLDDAINRYLSTLQSMWAAAVDVAALLQTNDLFGLGQNGCVEPVGDVAGLVAIGPTPCPGRTDPRLLEPNREWNLAVPPKLVLEQPELLPPPKPEAPKDEKKEPGEPKTPLLPLELPPVASEANGKPKRPRDVFASDRADDPIKMPVIPASSVPR